MDAALLKRKREARMNAVDGMAPEWRELVHEYGLNIVTAMLDAGVRKPKNARHIVDTVISELSPISGAMSRQGPRNKPDDYLVLVPREPSEAMIEASMATVAGHDVSVTKHEKHRRRLVAAINAAIGRRAR